MVFINRRAAPVALFWMDPQGQPRPYGIIAPGTIKRQSTRPGAVWRLAQPDGGKPLGHFTVGDRPARAVIPPK